MKHLSMSKNEASALPAVNSLEAYMEYVKQIPMLSLETEKALTEKLFNFNDLEAARQLILSHLRFVVHMAQGYSGYGLALGDLIQEGNVGLMKAVKRFNPSFGVRLVTFAVHWIKAEIHEFILRNWRIVRIATTKAQKKLFFKLRSTKKRLGLSTQSEIEAVAKELGVDVRIVHEMEIRMNAYDTSFELSGDEEAEGEVGRNTLVPARYLTDERYNPASQFEVAHSIEQGQLALQQGLQLLDMRSRDIVQKRWLSTPKATLQELAKQHQISLERVRQLERKAMDTLKNLLKNMPI